MRCGYARCTSGDGWTVDEVVDEPMIDESRSQIGTSTELTAAKGSMTFSLVAELFDRDAQHTYNVRVGLSEQ